MRAHDGTLAFLTIFAWLVGCGLSGPPTPPPESPLSLPEKIFNKIGENAKLIMVLLKYQKFWNQQIILSTQMLFPSQWNEEECYKRWAKNVSKYSASSFGQFICILRTLIAKLATRAGSRGSTVRWKTSPWTSGTPPGEFTGAQTKTDRQKRTNANTQTKINNKWKTVHNGDTAIWTFSRHHCAARTEEAE